MGVCLNKGENVLKRGQRFNKNFYLVSKHGVWSVDSRRSREACVCKTLVLSRERRRNRAPDHHAGLGKLSGRKEWDLF